MQRKCVQGAFGEDCQGLEGGIRATGAVGEMRNVFCSSLVMECTYH